MMSRNTNTQSTTIAAPRLSHQPIRKRGPRVCSHRQERVRSGQQNTSIPAQLLAGTCRVQGLEVEPELRLSLFGTQGLI